MKNVISNFAIKMFRGIKNLELSNLSTINILAGVNNSGKTSVLESISFMSAPESLGRLTSIAFLRAPIARKNRPEKRVEYISSLFHKEVDEDECSYNIDVNANIYGQEYYYSSSGDIETQFDTVGESYKVFLFSSKFRRNDGKPDYTEYLVVNNQNENNETIIEKKNYSLYFSLFLHSGINYYNSCVSLISEAVIMNHKANLLKIINSFDSSVNDISTSKDDIYLHNDATGTLPLFAYGTGLQKAVLLSVVLLVCANGVLLIDEIDNAINMSAFKSVFPWFVEQCRKLNIQAFVTTHSMEAIDAILEATRNDEKNGLEDDIRIITLRKTKKTNKTVAKVRTGKEARSDREQFEMELRV